MNKPGDIRNKQTDKDYWSSFEKTWTSLLTYRYLGRGDPALDQGVTEIAMPLRHDMRNAQDWQNDVAWSFFNTRSLYNNRIIFYVCAPLRYACTG